MAEQDSELRDLVGQVAASYFSNVHVAASEIAQVIQQIASSLSSVGVAADQADPAPTDAQPEQRRATPAQIRKSISPDGLVSFEDAKSYKTLKRHLTGRGMTPQLYREKWGLPRDYPMVAPNYSAARSEMARSIGLGRKVEIAVEAFAIKPRRGRSRA